jgi:YesN/AraC family two-component response regulator
VVPKLRVLLVDDNGGVLQSLKLILESHDFEVTPAGGVSEALRLIVSQDFDVLVTDLHMPNVGDGFALVTAMRHSQPQALTVVISGYPDVQEAIAAILLQADEILVKPLDASRLAALVRKKVENSNQGRAARESVASILERDVALTIKHWLSRAHKVETLDRLRLSDDERTQYLQDMTREIVLRLREKPLMETAARESPAAVAHGQLRYRQGYTAPLLVEESRILQVCIFETIKRNLGTVDFSLLLPDIMLIADEIDSQLTQSVESLLTLQQSAAAEPKPKESGRSGMASSL